MAKGFAETAKDLARNSLGLIALFLVLVHAIASLVVGASPNLDAGDRRIIVWFLVTFPVLVLGVFGWLGPMASARLRAASRGAGIRGAPA